MKYVSMIKHRQGFTLAEVLLSLTVLMTALLILVPLLNQLRPEDWNADWSSHQFSQLLQEELNDATHIQTHENILSLTNREKETVTIEQYQNVVRRRVSGKGHEVWLYDINNIKFSSLPGSLRLHIEFKGGETFEKIFFTPEK